MLCPLAMEDEEYDREYDQRHAYAAHKIAFFGGMGFLFFGALAYKLTRADVVMLPALVAGGFAWIYAGLKALEAGEHALFSPMLWRMGFSPKTTVPGPTARQRRALLRPVAGTLIGVGSLSIAGALLAAARHLGA